MPFHDAPIPGQSLTQAPGASPMTKPSQFAEEHKALDYVWNVILSDPKTVIQMMVFLKRGMTITEIVNTLLWGGVAAGKWSLDIGFLMYQEVCWMIEALAKIRKIKYSLKRPDPKYQQFLLKYQDYIKDPSDTPVEQVVNKAFGNSLSVPTIPTAKTFNPGALK